MKTFLLTIGLIIVIMAVSFIDCSAEVACISGHSIRIVEECSECRTNERCGAIVTAPQNCPVGEFVIGFNVNGELVCSSITTLLDADGDGQISVAFGGLDCDDSNPYIYAGAEETCDTFDNDCNGIVDDRDIDNDGYIDDICGGDDCDDFNNSVNPGAKEICDDSLDNDCDGETDEQDCLQKPQPGDIIFNEVLINGNVDGDANADGKIDGTEDEFVEIINVSSVSVDLSGCILFENTFEIYAPRHTFSDGTFLPAGEVIVVFGGGTPPNNIVGAQYLTADDSNGLHLDDSGDVISLAGVEGTVITEFAYGDQGGEEAVVDQSIVRDPDGIGGFVRHTDAEGSEGSIFSPGYKINGTNFP